MYSGLSDTVSISSTGRIIEHMFQQFCVHRIPITTKKPFGMDYTSLFQKLCVVDVKKEKEGEGGQVFVAIRYLHCPAGLWSVILLPRYCKVQM